MTRRWCAGVALQVVQRRDVRSRIRDFTWQHQPNMSSRTCDGGRTCASSQAWCQHVWPVELHKRGRIRFCLWSSRRTLGVERGRGKKQVASTCMMFSVYLVLQRKQETSWMGEMLRQRCRTTLNRSLASCLFGECQALQALETLVGVGCCNFGIVCEFLSCSSAALRTMSRPCELSRGGDSGAGAGGSSDAPGRGGETLGIGRPVRAGWTGFGPGGRRVANHCGVRSVERA